MPRKGRTLEHPAIPTHPCSFRASRPLAPGQLLSWLPFSPSQAAITPPHLPFPGPSHLQSAQVNHFLML